MANDISTGMLLEHMQGMKNDLQQQIAGLDNKVEKGFSKVDRKFEEIDRKFEEAKQHRQALQEDLDASIRMLGKHEAKLSRL